MLHILQSFNIRFSAIKHAFFQVIRLPYRSIISISVVAFGCISLVLFGGFVESMYDGMRENMIHSQLGHLQIFAKGFEEKGSVDPELYLISPENIGKLTLHFKNNPNIVAITSRLHLNGIISNGKESTTFVGMGVNPTNEQQLSSSLHIREGQDLFAEQTDGILLGEVLAKAINAKVEDRLTILTSTVDGGMNAGDVTVTGIVSTGITDLDARYVRMPLPYVQRLADTDKVTKLVILLKDTQSTDLMKNELLSYIQSENLPVEVRDWSKMADYYHEVVGLFNGIFKFIKMIVVTIVLISISSIMVINVIERTREIGTIRSIGATRMDILLNFMLEGLWIGLIGSLLGILLGALFAKQVNVMQFPMPRPPGSSVDYPLRIFIENKTLLESFFIGCLSTLVSSFYPALKAVRMNIVDAIRFA